MIASSLSILWRAAGLSDPVEEFRFHPLRKWRFDYAWPELLFAMEIEGVTRQGGRHQRLAGYQQDCEKYAEALCLGWRVLRVTPKQIQNGQALGWLTRWRETHG